MKRYTYFASCNKTGLVKIGCSKNPRARVRQLRPIPVLFAAVEDCHLSESDAHEMFSKSRCIKEWFNIDKESVIFALKQLGAPFIGDDRIAGMRPARVDGREVNGMRKVLVSLTESEYQALREQSKREGRPVSRQACMMILRELGLRSPERSVIA
jgi:hypothetical protein